MNDDKHKRLEELKELEKKVSKLKTLESLIQTFKDSSSDIGAIAKMSDEQRQKSRQQLDKLIEEAKKLKTECEE